MTINRRSAGSLSVVIVGVVAAMALAAAIGVSFANRAAPRTSEPPSGTATGPGSTAPAGPGATATAPATPGSTGSPTNDRGKHHTATGGGSASPGVSEVLPTPATSVGAIGHQPPPTPAAPASPLLGSTPPKPGTAKGHLVTGFPVGLAPPKRARIVSSSVSVSGGIVQASLVAAGGDPQAILLHYREQLSARGFHETTTQGVENAPAAAFTKGDDRVTVTTSDGRTYVLASLRSAGGKG